MNRHQRRAQKASGVSGVSGQPTTADTLTPVPQGQPSFLLKAFGRLLLANWVLKRVNHPDLLVILLQIAEQTGRTDAVVQLTTKLHLLQR
jgi:hypothetical protein